jgi:hypothetical protein
MRRRSTGRSTRSRFARPVLLACAIALGSIALACGSHERSTPQPSAKPPEPTQGAPAPAPSAAAVPGGAGAEASPEALLKEGVVPEGFPSDVPVYPGATAGSSLSTPGQGVFATFASDDPVDKVLSHYRGELAKNGWSVVDTAQGDGVDGTRGNRSVSVRVRRDEENHTEIAIDVETT